MKNSNNEPKKLMKPGTEGARGPVFSCGTNFFGAEFCRISAGICHFETAISHHSPDKSTQVVDFPHLAMVRFFWEQGFYRRDTETQSQKEQDSEGGGSFLRFRAMECGADFRGKKCGLFGFPSPPRDGCPREVVRLRETWSHCYAKFHESSHRSGP